MTSKRILYEQTARRRILAGVNAIADAVQVTLGPCGRNVILERSWYAPRTTKDGVSVAKAVWLSDPVANMGVDMVRQAAQRTVDEAGDGTTTATVLARAMYAQGLALVEAGVPPVELQRQISAAAQYATEVLRRDFVFPSGDEHTLRAVARTAANGDEHLANLVVEGAIAVGETGILTTEMNRRSVTELSVTEGVTYDRGYYNAVYSVFATNGAIELYKPYILLLDTEFHDYAPLVPLFEKIRETKRPVLVVASDVSIPTAAFFFVNTLDKKVQTVHTPAPAYGDHRTETLTDIAIATGGRVHRKDLLEDITRWTLDDLGQADKVTVTKDHTIIEGGKGAPEAVAERVRQLRVYMETATDELRREKLLERVAKLTSGIAVVKIGGETSIEQRERKDRVDDTIAAITSAISEGVVMGGGMALFFAADALSERSDFGSKVVADAMRQPFLQMLKNAAIDEIPDLSNCPRDRRSGYDVVQRKVIDLYAAGILDSYKVHRVALTNAASVAGTMLTIEATLSEVRK